MDAWSPSDPATVVTHALASTVSPALAARLLETTTRAILEQAAREHGGVVLMGHGSRAGGGAFLFSDYTRALDPANAHVLADRWCYALACWLGGLDIARHAVGAGCLAFVGYDDEINVAWSYDALAAPVRAALDDLVASVPIVLASGVRDARAIRRAAGDARDAFLAAIDREDVHDFALISFGSALGGRDLAITLP